MGAVVLMYGRDVILIVILGHALALSLLKGRCNKTLMFLLLTLMIFSFVGLFYVGNLLQIAFSLKIVLPLLVGVICYRCVVSNTHRLSRFLLFSLSLAVIGVYLNYFVAFPWVGLTYTIAGIEIEGGFERTTSGVSRLLGFSRTNFEAATQIIILSAYVVVFTKGTLRVCLSWLLAGGAIVLTTTKGIIVTYLLLTVFFLLFNAARGFRPIYHFFLALPLAAMIILPLSLHELDIDLSDPIQVTLYASVADRIYNGWPAVMNNVTETANIVTGRGVGGTGAGEYYFASEVKGAPDNLFVYLYSWFGLFSVGMLAFLFWKSLQLDVSRRLDFVIFLWLLSFFTYGIGSAAIESAFFALFFGFCIAHLTTTGKWASANDPSPTGQGLGSR